MARTAVNQWLRWYAPAGTEALRPSKAPGPAPRLSLVQHQELARLIEAGPQAAGYMGDLWTSPRPRIGDLIRRRFGVRKRAARCRGVVVCEVPTSAFAGVHGDGGR